MQIDIDECKMKEIMKSFYTLTHIRIAIVNIECHEIMGYPEHFTEFCTYMRSNPNSCVNCVKSDFQGFEQCRKTGKINIYKCHAGLTEAAYPLYVNGTVIGYIMFGQITDEKDRRNLTSTVLSRCEPYGVSLAKLRKAIGKLEYKSREELIAAATIFETSVYFILHKQFISARGEQLVIKLNRYIEKNIAQPIHVDAVAQDLLISRTQLYTLTRQYLGMGIAEYIRNKRMEKAKELLAETDLFFADISERVGYDDYNYFRRSFKKYEGISLGTYRKRLSMAQSDTPDVL